MNTEFACPKCAAPTSLPRCGNCGIQLTGPLAAELWRVDMEIGRLRQHRETLLAQLSQQPVAPEIEPPSVSSARRPPRRSDAAAGRSPEMTGRAAARLLLAVGTALLVIAAAAFTIANWGSIGPAGRLAILLGMTSVAVTAPWPVRRRGLHATAEAVAAVGLALSLADIYLARWLAPSLRPGPVMMAAVCTVLAAVWTGYGKVTGLTGPRLAAIAAAQFPLPLAAAGLPWGGSGPTCLALAATSAADVVLAVRMAGRRAEAVVASACAALVWLAAIAGAAVLPIPVLWLAATFVAAAVTGIAAENRMSSAPARVVTPVCGGLLAIGVAAPAASALSHGWNAVTFVVAGLAIASPGLRWQRWRLVAVGSAAVAGAIGLLSAAVALAAMFGGAKIPALHALVGPAATTLALIGASLVGASLLGAARLSDTARRAMTAGSVIAATLAAGCVPDWAVLAVLSAAVAGLYAIAVLVADLRWAAALCGLAVAASGVVRSQARMADLAALTVISGVAAALARRSPVVQVTTGTCVAAATGLAVPEPYTVPAAAAILTAGWRLFRRGRREPSSWLVYGPGLAVLLVPSLVVTWQGTGWIRPAVLGVAAAGVALLGARARLQAPLLVGAAVAVIDAGHALAPSVLRLVRLLPGWAPVAIIGVFLLWAGATYEARLRDLGKARGYLSGLR